MKTTALTLLLLLTFAAGAHAAEPTNLYVVLNAEPRIVTAGQPTVLYWNSFLSGDGTDTLPDRLYLTASDETGTLMARLEVLPKDACPIWPTAYATYGIELPDGTKMQRVAVQVARPEWRAPVVAASVTETGTVTWSITGGSPQMRIVLSRETHGEGVPRSGSATFGQLGDTQVVLAIDPWGAGYGLIWRTFVMDGGNARMAVQDAPDAHIRRANVAPEDYLATLMREAPETLVAPKRDEFVSELFYQLAARRFALAGNWATPARHPLP